MLNIHLNDDKFRSNPNTNESLTTYITEAWYLTALLEKNP